VSRACWIMLPSSLVRMFDIIILGNSFVLDVALCSAALEIILSSPLDCPVPLCQDRVRLLSCSDTPVAVENPGALLAFFAAILRPSASSALGELSCEFLPLPTLVVCTLSYSPA